MKNILVTGGVGFIGSHTSVELINEGYNVVIVDNLSNSKKEVISAIKKITKKSLVFYECDIRDKEKLTAIFEKEKIDTVIHFAGLKAVGESVEKPLLYYNNNIEGSINLFEIMKEFNVREIIFSSSATVYGNPEKLPITEDMPFGEITNPYGQTKAMIEKILTDMYIAYPELKITLLRYFNPVGAHKSGLIGENPKGIPNNLMPIIIDVALGKRKNISIYGHDYSTKDGTGVRDYIHVTDLSRGHVAALKNMKKGISIYNLGTGNGYSVLEMISTFEKVNKIKIPYLIADRRNGDIATCYADCRKAKQELNWEAKKNLNDMCEDAWNYAKLKEKIK